MSALYFEGKKFIPSKQAAQVTGYARDYIGQICRANLVEAKLVGRSWYVSEESILAYARDHESEKELQAQEASARAREIHEAIIREESAKKETVEAKKIIKYEVDNRPLMPILASRDEAPIKAISASSSKGIPSLVSKAISTKKPSRNYQKTIRQIDEFLSPYQKHVKEIGERAIALLIAMSMVGGSLLLPWNVAQIANNIKDTTKEVAIDTYNAVAKLASIDSTELADIVASTVDEVVADTKETAIAFKDSKDILVAFAKGDKTEFIAAAYNALTGFDLFARDIYIGVNDFFCGIFCKEKETVIVEREAAPVATSTTVVRVVERPVYINETPAVITTPTQTVVLAGLTRAELEERLLEINNRLNTEIYRLEQQAENIERESGRQSKQDDRILDNFSDLELDIDTVDTLTITDSLTVTGNTTIIQNGLEAGGVLYIDSVNNRVGIGTSSPADTLSIDGAVYLADIAPTDTASRLYNDGGDLYWDGNLVAGALIGTWNSSGGNVYRSTGNVGIGTTSPFARLSVGGDAYIGGNITATGTLSIAGLATFADLTFTNATGTSATTTNLFANNAIFGNITSYSTAIAPTFTATSTTATSTFAGGLAVETSGFVYDYSTNNVGIGTSSPISRLHIEGANDVTGGITVASNVGTSNNRLAIYPSGNFTTNFQKLNSVGALNFLNSGGSSEMIISSTGNIGIASSSPYTRLSVNGDAVITDNLRTSYITATSTTATSTFAGGITGPNNFTVQSSSGNVGIGTTTPDSPLSIIGRGATGATNAVTVTDSNGINRVSVMDNGRIFVNATTTNQADSVFGVRIDPTNTADRFAIIRQPAAGTSNPSVSVLVNVSNINSSTSGLYANYIQTTGGIVVGGELAVSATGIRGHDTTGVRFQAGHPLRTTSGPLEIAPTTNTIITSGNLGIATTSPFEKLSVVGSGYFSGSITATNITATGTLAALNIGVTNRNIAEKYNTFDNTLASGEIVAVDDAGDGYVKRASYTDRADIIGVVTSNAGLILNKDNTTDATTVAVAGRATILVNNEGGDINIGDRVGLSATAGVGAKATTSTNVIGIATQFFNAIDGTGSIEVLIQPEEYLADTQFYIDGSGNIGIGTTSPYLRLSVNGSAIITDNLRTSYITATSTTATSTFAGGVTGPNNFTIQSSSGNVGIGTTTPTQKLEVAGGNIQLDNNYYLRGRNASLTEFNILGVDSSNQTNMYSQGAASPIRFLNGATESMRIVSGNIGIGTSSPYLRLSVNGSGVITDNLTTSYITATSTTATSTFAGGLAVETSGLVYDYSTNNVGIGTASPQNKLVVSGGSTRIYNDNSTTGDTAFLTLEQDGAGDASLVFLLTGTRAWQMGIDNSDSDKFKLGYTQSSTWSDNAFVMDTSGNLGLGTSSPASRIDLYSTSANDPFISHTRSNGSGIRFTGAGGTPQTAKIQVTSNGGGTYVDTMNIVTTSGGAYTQGDIGIGTSTPNTKLTITATGANGLNIDADTSVTTQSGRFFLSTGTAGQSTVIMNTNGNLSFRTGATVGINSGTEHMILSSTGNLGVGTTTPGAKLAITNSGSGHTFWASDQADTDATPFVIDASGNVGIGTSSPQALLSIATASAGGINIDTTSITGRADINFSENGVNTATAQWRSSSNASLPSTFRFGTNIAGGDVIVMTGAGASTMLLDGATQNVGIGTTSPYARLSVNGNGVITDNLRTSYITATSTTATSTFAGGVDIGSGALRYDLSTTVTTIDNLQIGALGFDTNAGIVSWIDLPVTSAAAAGTIQSYSAGIDGTSLLTVYAESNGAGGIQNAAIGIGTSTPISTLSIQGSLCVRDTGACGTTAGTIYATTATITDIDLAENYATTDATITAGEIVAADPTTANFIKRADGSENPVLLGIISTKPGLLLGKEIINGKPVALSGRVPLKVNAEGGDIAIGDRIMLSSVPGVGTKANTSGQTVAIAIQSFDASMGTGTIEAFVHLEQHFVKEQFHIDNSGNIGIGTTTPLYKLHVVGDAAATSFINISTRDEKKDINYLTEEDRADILGKIRGMKVAEYHYDFEGRRDPLRLGLIAEEAPSEVLSATGKGVDIYKLSTFILAGVQAQQVRIDTIEARLANIESLLGVATSTNNSFSLDSLNDYFDSIGASLTASLVSFKNLVAETFKVGTPEKPTGITLYDEETGEPYCLSIASGKTKVRDGECTVHTIEDEEEQEEENNNETSGTNEDVGTSTPGTSGDDDATPPATEGGNSTEEETTDNTTDTQNAEEENDSESNGDTSADTEVTEEETTSNEEPDSESASESDSGDSSSSEEESSSDTESSDTSSESSSSDESSSGGDSPASSSDSSGGDSGDSSGGDSGSTE